MNRSARAAGFTLLEVLVAMTVLGVLTGLLTSGLGFGVRVWEHERSELDDWSDLQTVQGIIRRVLSQAWPLNVPGPNGTQTGGFLGTATAIRFLGPSPAQSLPGGIYKYTLISRPDPDGLRLILTWQRQAPEPRRPARSGAAPAVEEGPAPKEVVLAEHLATAVFSYFGAAEEGTRPSWKDQWDDATKLPQLVRVHITYLPGDRRRWPELIVAFSVNGTPGEG